MWKTMAFCVSLFAAVLAVLVTSASYFRFRPSALALLAAIGLSLVGAVLIWMAPDGRSRPARTLSLRQALAGRIAPRLPRETKPGSPPPIDAIHS